MKTALLFAFILFAKPILCQNADSTAIRQVDSLLQVSRDLTAKRECDKALDVNEMAEKIALDKLGRESAAYGSCCFNHGRVLYFKKEYPEAEKWYLEAKAIREKALGKENPDYAHSLNNLAVLYFKLGQYEKAEPLYLELSTANKRLMESATLHLSEKELNHYLNLFSQSQDELLSFTQTTNIKKLIPVCYDNSLFYKGFLLRAAGRIKQFALTDEGATEKFNQLKVCRRRLAAQYAQPIAERDSALVAELETRSENLEKDLVRSVAGWDDARRQVYWQDVQATLREADAAVELVHYRYTDKKATDSTLYAALVLLPGNQPPLFIPLFEEKQLDSLLLTHDERKADYVNTLYTLAERGAKPLGKPQKTLYELLWQPLETHLQGANTVFFSPSGLLHRLNLAAVPINLDSVLGDRYNLVELGSTRQLVIPSEVKPAANDAVLFGGIQYDSDSTAMSQANAALDSISIASRGELSFSYTDSTLRIGTWSALPFTDREVNSVEKTLKSTGFRSETRRGAAATEEAFKTIGAGSKPSPRVLHLVTHGFFFPDPTNSPSPLERGLGGDAEPAFKLSDHPMIRSGLILAGANHAWATGKPLREGIEDGILTAYEISQMNLSKTPNSSCSPPAKRAWGTSRATRASTACSGRSKSPERSA